MSFAVLYGRETGTLYQREEHRFRVFENRVLRKIHETEGEEAEIT